MKNFSAKNAEFETVTINNEAAITSANIGTDPNKIPLNKDLGSLAYQDAVNLDDVSADMLELRAIAAEISDSAVDVFVYDTSRDSDGGAWRKRTQHTSWYNEELNTATRGGRREFPAVAVIVAEANKVTIYDGDDPDLPMWMVFDVVSNMNLITATSGTTVSSITALNGVVGVACNGSSPHFTPIDFISEKSGHYTTSGNKYFLFDISSRNNTSSPAHGSYDGSVSIVNSFVNDVSMTILPNAPIDENTGLPVPTIAVATDGGVSVIRDDGSVESNGSFGKIQKVAIDNKHNLYIFRDMAEDYVVSYGFVENEISNFTNEIGVYSFRNGRFHTSLATNQFHLSSTSDDVVSGQDYGLLKVDTMVGDFNNELFSYITSKYNTGWMPGDIKLATLSDTTVETIGAATTELITNGDFSAGDDGSWTDYSSTNLTTSEISTEQSYLGNNSWKFVASLANSGISQSHGVYTEQGRLYTLSGYVYSSTGKLWLRWRNGNDSGYIVDNYELVSGAPNTWLAFSITAKETGSGSLGGIRLVANAAGTFYVDGLSIRLAEPDRSVNNNGLQVIGEINKAKVAPGADLVAYSGFSENDYLVQPYNADLDFGTGDFSIALWFNFSAGVEDQKWDDLFSLGDLGYQGTSNASSFIHAQLNTVSDYLDLYIGGFNTTGKIASISNLSRDTWSHVVLTRKNGIATAFINGSQYASKSNNLSIGGAGLEQYNLRIGYTGDNYGVPGVGFPANYSKIALFRVSKTAPTPDQIAKIYRDEKVLFQDDAQATLHGTSDSVTALAYDEKTELLHVGTASGRSDFSGLRRINNTTTAVTTSISAHNNLIAEQ